MSTADNKKIILSLIASAQKEYTVSKLSGGNCGTFALALARELEDRKIKGVTIGVLFKDETQEAETPQQILDMETDVYHVVLEYANDRYDGTGKTTNTKLLQLAKRDYRDNNPSFVTDISPKDKHLVRLIDNDTNWNIDSNKFQMCFKKV